MKILHTTPPNYPQLCAAFPALVNNLDVIFAYGAVVYVPSGRKLPPYKMVHEMVHGEQQLEVGVEWWWERYMENKDFRLQEEIPAHHADYKSFCRHYKDKNQQADYLNYLAEQLSGALYGNIIGKTRAGYLIKHGG